jgi:cytochrome c
MNLRARFVLALSCAVLSTAAVAEDRGTPEDAIALWNKGRAYFEKNGAQATMAAFDDKTSAFFDRDLYFVCYGSDDKLSAIGGNPKLVGMSASDFRDADGRVFALDILKVGRSGTNGWVDYKWADPITKKIMPKSLYVGAFGDYVCGVGIYK